MLKVVILSVKQELAQNEFDSLQPLVSTENKSE